MKNKAITLLLIILTVSPLFYVSLTAKAAVGTSPDVYVGVDVAYQSVPLTEQLIDNVNCYTNIFVVGCSGSYNLTRLTILSQYAYDKGMSFIVYSNTNRYPSHSKGTNSHQQMGRQVSGNLLL